MRTTNILLVALAALIPATFASDAHATQYRSLCTSVASACEYTGPDAPVLRAAVCWDGSVAILMDGSCPSGTWPYYVEHGEVIDPLTNAVAAYVPLDWACDHPGICVSGTPPTAGPSVPLCCGSNGCFEVTNAGCVAGQIKVLCQNGVSNLDGTITCFEETPLP